MTEEKIFKILLNINNASDRTFSDPKLQTEAINIVAKNVTDIIYESLKQKSSTSSTKRGNILVILITFLTL